MSIVKVKDLVQYLQTLDQEADVDLDKDGWMEEDCAGDPNDPQNLIRQRGIFNYYAKPAFADGPYLVINN